MKSSWSSPTPASLDPSIYSQRSGCILSVLRRMLCSTSLLTHPPSESDHRRLMTEEKKEKKLAAEKAVPSLVARLMGLDSIPERKFTRSRSLNSAGHLKKEEDEDGERSLGKKLHRRSKSSLSFRESPTYIELDDDEFIVLRFDKGPPTKALLRSRSRDKPSSAGNDEELGQSSMEQECHNQRRAANSRSRKQTRLVKKKMTAESSDSEESSPVSIFDFQGTDTTPTSAEEDSWTRSSISSRVSASSPEPDNTKISTEQDDPMTEAVESKMQQKKHALLSSTVVVASGQKRNREMWVSVCDITVAEIKGAAEWGDKDAKDLAAEVEVHITDLLLYELLHSL